MSTGPDHVRSDDLDVIEIDLKNPGVAALLAWLVPGLGHMYQRRWGKGILFMVCILGTFFSGMYLGEGRVVYASWRPEDRRYPFFLQVGAGLPALPALVSMDSVGRMYSPPRFPRIQPEEKDRDPRPWHDEQGRPYSDELSKWNIEMGDRFEMGTVYTMIAGLLNVLVIYDAFAGPVIILPGRKEDGEPGRDPPTEKSG